MFLAGVLVAAAMMFQGVDDTGTAIARPIGEVKLEPTTGSYFQMFEFYGRPPYSWQHAQRMVRGYRYQEREGRLAHVKSGAVHYFLLLNFTELLSKKAWIGLSAKCGEKAEIEWLDGSILGDQSFRAWNDGTQRKISRECAASKLSGKLFPVFYESHELGLRWETAAEKANLQYMMVEFAETATEEAVEEEAKEEKAEPTPEAGK